MVVIAGATVTVTDECDNDTQGTTDEHGQYCVEVVSGSNCIIPKVDPSDCPECETFLTEHDCSLIGQLTFLILGLPHTLTLAQILAADVNRDGEISTIDLIGIWKGCLGIPNNVDLGNCHYVPASELNPDNPNG